jgi:hypothetical protein
MAVQGRGVCVYMLVHVYSIYGQFHSNENWIVIIICNLVPPILSIKHKNGQFPVEICLCLMPLSTHQKTAFPSLDVPALLGASPHHKCQNDVTVCPPLLLNAQFHIGNSALGCLCIFSSLCQVMGWPSAHPLVAPEG